VEQILVGLAEQVQQHLSVVWELRGQLELVLLDFLQVLVLGPLELLRALVLLKQVLQVLVLLVPQRVLLVLRLELQVQQLVLAFLLL